MTPSEPQDAESTAESTLDAGRNDVDSQKLQALLGSAAAVQVQSANGTFTLYEPQLGLLVSCSDLSAGYRQLMADREKRLRELDEAGILHLVPDAKASQAPARGPSVLVQLRPFLIKAVVVAGLMLYFLSAIGGALRDVGYNLEKQLDGVSHWGPDKTEMYREKSQRIADRLGPIVRALLPMFHETAQNATGQGAMEQNATEQNATSQGSQAVAVDNAARK